MDSSQTIHYIEVGNFDTGTENAKAGVYRNGNDVVTRFMNTENFKIDELLAEEFFMLFNLI